MNCPDSNWSKPGETAGARERYQQRHLGGLLLTAGHNAMERGPSGEYGFVVPAAKTPWHVYATLPNPHFDGAMALTEVASGTASSQARARNAAEAAALEYLKAHQRKAGAA